MNSRSYKIGALLWVLSIQYYIVQLLVAARWSNPSFSWTQNTISDLGNTVCGQYGSRVVCSPLHPVMNASFIVLGITMAIGAILLSKQLSKNIQARLGFGAMVLAGVGTVMVGLFPENTIGLAHGTGAALPFVLGNIGMILIGSCVPMHPAMKAISIGLGVLALVALVLFVGGASVGIGHGGLERVVAYPQSIWMIIFGVYLLHKRHER